MVDTVMLRIALDPKTYNLLFGYANNFFTEHHLGKLYPDKKISKRYLTTKLSPLGFLEIAFHKTNYNWYLEIKLQPIRLIKENESIELSRWEDFLAIEPAFNNFLATIFYCGNSGKLLPEWLKLESWKVCRLDYAFQFRTPYIQTYVDLLHRGQILYYQKKHDYESSLYVTANTHNLNFYDKYAQLKDKPHLLPSTIEHAENLLRFEVQCKEKYLQKLKRRFKLNKMNLRELWNVYIAEYVLKYRIRMLVGEQDFYQLAVAENEIKSVAGNNAFLLCEVIRNIALTENIQLAKRIFHRNHRWIAEAKYDKLLWRLRKNILKGLRK